jgi:hypothetical protein
VLIEAHLNQQSFSTSGVQMKSSKLLYLLTASAFLLCYNSVATAQWAVNDASLNSTANNIKSTADSINAKLNTLNTTILRLGPTNSVAPTAIGAGTTDLETGLNEKVANNTGTYGQATAGIVFPAALVTPCATGQDGNALNRAVTPRSTQSAADCKMTREIMAAAYNHSIEYYRKFKEYNAQLRGYLSTTVPVGELGALAALQFRVQGLHALQQNEATLYNINMEMHKSALGIIKERKRQIDKERLVGDGTSASVNAALLLAGFLPTVRIRP